MISSTGNKQIKNLIQLQKKSKVRNEQELFVVEGIKMFEEAKSYGLVKAFASEDFFNEQIQRNKDYFNDIDIELVAESVFKEVADTMTPQGILAMVRKPSYALERILDKDTIRLLLLEDIRDPGNLGTMIRTAEGAGFSAVVMSQETVDIFNPKVIRSTMGSIYRIPFFYVKDFYGLLEELKEKKITIFAAHLQGRRYYDETQYPDRAGILIGNESSGLSGEASALADSYIKIPMGGKVESLNAAVAAAILMYEVERQGR